MDGRTPDDPGRAAVLLCRTGEWLHEKHGTKVRRSWRKLHLGMDAGTGQIVASLLTTHDGPLAASVRIFTVRADFRNYDEPPYPAAFAEPHRRPAACRDRGRDHSFYSRELAEALILGAYESRNDLRS